MSESLIFDANERCYKREDFIKRRDAGNFMPAPTLIKVRDKGAENTASNLAEKLPMFDAFHATF